MSKQVDLRNVPFDKVYERELDKALSVFKRYEYKKVYSGNKIYLNIKSDESKLKKWFSMNYDHIDWNTITRKYEYKDNSTIEEAVKIIKDLLKPVSKYIDVRGTEFKRSTLTFYIVVNNMIIIEPLLLTFAHEEDIITYKEISRDKRKAVDIFKALDFEDTSEIIKRVINNTFKNSNKPSYIEGYELKVEPGDSLLNSNLEISFKIDLNNI